MAEDDRRFLESLERAGLGQYVDAIAALSLPSIRLRQTHAGSPPVGSSRLGGAPDMPAGFRWPHFEGLPLAFIAQIALSDLGENRAWTGLPEDGWLAFFYDVDQRSWGFDPRQSKAAQVIYTPSDVAIAPQAFPDDLPSRGRHRRCALMATRETSFPSWEAPELQAAGLSRDELVQYLELMDDAFGTTHRMFGHPQEIQGEMRLEVQLVSHGIYCGDSSGYRDPRAQELREGAADWQLLLQVDTDEDAHMMWGDNGRIYYWITQAAIAQADWSSAHLILQCY